MILSMEFYYEFRNSRIKVVELRQMSTDVVTISMNVTYLYLN